MIHGLKSNLSRLSESQSVPGVIGRRRKLARRKKELKRSASRKKRKKKLDRRKLQPVNQSLELRKLRNSMQLPLLKRQEHQLLARIWRLRFVL
jgi:hypothetical protein